MIGATRNHWLRFHRRPNAAPKRHQGSRFNRWTGLLSLGLLSILAICWTTSPDDRADAQEAKAGKAVKAATRPIPGAGQKLDSAALTQIIDQEINSRLKAEGMPASARASDSEFIRRAFLDLVGVI